MFERRLILTEVVSVRFKNKGKVYFFDPNNIKIKTGDDVIVETSKGLEYAGCTWGNHWVSDTSIVPPLRPVVRVATEEDAHRFEENKRLEKEAFDICQEKILAHEMDMKLVDVEYNFEGTKILFFFTSDGRVDFRELVKDLAAIFHTRIELRQIGVRDEARMLGGLGICGKPFCCSQFLDEFHPVTIKMAKTQGLSLNPTKISGTCGRLMCCLKYEQVAYEDLVQKAPKVDAFVDTPGGKGAVISVNLLRSNAKVKLEDGDTTLKTYSFDELEILGGKARRAEYLAAKAEGTLEEAGFVPSQLRASKAESEKPKLEEEAPFYFADGSQKAMSESKTEENAREAVPKQNKNHKPKHKKPQNPKPITAEAQREQKNEPSAAKEANAESRQKNTHNNNHYKKPNKPKAAEKPQQQADPENAPKQEKQHSAKRRYYGNHYHKKPNKPKSDRPSSEG